MPQSGTLSVLNLLAGQKSGFSLRRGDSLNRFTSNLAWPTGTWSAWLCNISPQSAQGGGVGMRPLNNKKFHFGKESPRKGEHLDRFLILGDFIRLSILH